MSKKEKKPKEKYSYAFPNIMARAMAKVSMRAQMESSMMSQFLLILGLTFMILYSVFTISGQIFYKLMIIFNLICAWVLISSFLVTSYQQYTNYMETMEYDPDEEKRKIKSKGNIFKRIYLAIKTRKQRKKDKANVGEVVKDYDNGVKEMFGKDVEQIVEEENVEDIEKRDDIQKD